MLSLLTDPQLGCLNGTLGPAIKASEIKIMRKIGKKSDFMVKLYSTKKVIFVPYDLKSYDIFAAILGIALTVLSVYIIQDKERIINIMLKLVPGAFGSFILYSTVLNYLNFKFNKIIVNYQKHQVIVQKLLRKISIPFNNIIEFSIQVEKLEGIIDSKGTFKGADTLSCKIEMVTSSFGRIKLLSLPPYHTHGNEVKLVDKLKKEGMSIIKEIGVSKPVSWDGVLVQ